MKSEGSLFWKSQHKPAAAAFLHSWNSLTSLAACSVECIIFCSVGFKPLIIYQIYFLPVSTYINLYTP